MEPPKESNEEKQVVTVPLTWDPKFAGWVGAVCLFFFVVLSSRLMKLMFEANLTEEGLARFIVLMLMIVGLFVTVGVVYLVLLELRGRAVTREEVRKSIPSKKDVKPQVNGGAVGEIIKVFPEALKAFSSLSASAALMVLVIFLFGFATLITYRTLPNPDAGAQEQTEASAENAATPAETPVLDEEN